MKNFSAVLIIVLMTCIFAIPVFADNPLFEAYPILPKKNQISDAPFWDLELKPKESQDLIMALWNRTSEEVTVMFEAITATTAVNGEVAYARQGISDESLRYSFRDIIIPNPIMATVPPKTYIEILIPLTAPLESYSGIILGAIHTSVFVVDYSESSNGIVNKYEYTHGVRLTQSRKQTSENPDFRWDAPQLLPGVKSTGFYLDVRNVVSALFNKTKVQTRIMYGGEVLFSQDKYVDFAPNSIYQLSLIRNTPLELGEYEMLVRVTTESGEQFSFKETFPVSELDPASDDANKDPSAQRRDAGDDPEESTQEGTDWLQIVFYVLVTMLILLLFIGLISIIGILIKRRKERDEQTNNAQQRIEMIEKKVNVQ